MPRRQKQCDCDSKKSKQGCGFTVLVDCEHAGALGQQLLHHHGQTVSCSHVKRPSGGREEKKTSVTGGNQHHHLIRALIMQRCAVAAWHGDTYVCKAALVAFMRFLSVIFSNINKALVSCPCGRTSTGRVSGADKYLIYVTTDIQWSPTHLTAGQVKGGVLHGVLQGEVRFGAAHQQLCRKTQIMSQISRITSLR